MAGSPGSQVHVNERLNFLNVGNRSSNRRSSVFGCLPKQSGPAAVGFGLPRRVNSTPANTRISFCLASVRRSNPPRDSSVMTNG